MASTAPLLDILQPLMWSRQKACRSGEGAQTSACLNSDHEDLVRDMDSGENVVEVNSSR